MTLNDLTPKVPTTPPSRAWSGASWCVRILLALFFAFVGTGKLAGAQQTVDMFDQIGAGQALSDSWSRRWQAWRHSGWPWPWPVRPSPSCTSSPATHGCRYACCCCAPSSPGDSDTAAGPFYEASVRVAADSPPEKGTPA